MNRLYVQLMTAIAETKSNERGAAGVEYGIMVAAIAAVIVVTAFLIGDEVSAAFNSVYAELTAV